MYLNKINILTSSSKLQHLLTYELFSVFAIYTLQLEQEQEHELVIAEYPAGYYNNFHLLQCPHLFVEAPGSNMVAVYQQPPWLETVADGEEHLSVFLLQTSLLLSLVSS